MSWYGYAPYVPVAQRRVEAARKIEKLKKKGRLVAPVVIEGKTIARSFWGKSWCRNLESYSDYGNRLPRGRTYVRNGSVCDLQIGNGQVTAMVMGSSMYDVRVTIAPVAEKDWAAICGDCSGSVGSLVELLQGKLSKNVMERVCRKVDGLFPSPRDIKLSCSCPDGARMCKHVAAAMYAIGARLDEKPDLLFTLRAVDEKELLARAGKNMAVTGVTPSTSRVIADDDIGALFGIDVDAGARVVSPAPLLAGSASASRRAGKIALASAKKTAPATQARKSFPNRAASSAPAPRRSPPQAALSKRPSAPRQKGARAKKAAGK